MIPLNRYPTSKYLSIGLLVALSLSSCSKETAPTTVDNEPTEEEITTVDVNTWLEPLDWEKELIEQYFSAREEAWLEGTEDGVEFIVNHNLGALGANVDTCIETWFKNYNGESIYETITPQWDTLKRDVGWSMPTGPRAGEDLGDSIFQVEVKQSIRGENGIDTTRRTRVHLQVLGNDVRNMVLCSPERYYRVVETPEPIYTQSPDGTYNPDYPMGPQDSVNPSASSGASHPSQSPNSPSRRPELPALPPINISFPKVPRPTGSPIVLPPVQKTGAPIVRPSKSPSPSPSQGHLPTASPKPSISIPPVLPSASPSSSPIVEPSKGSEGGGEAGSNGSSSDLPSAKPIESPSVKESGN